MTVATNRPDGWPQATTVGYASEGLTLYFFCALESQKAANIAQDNRISLTIDSDILDPRAIRGLSMAARASFVNDPDEVGKAINLLLHKYPEYKAMSPDMSAMRVFRVTPEIISLLDYSKGFGHTDLVHVDAADIRTGA
jgi:nitroimidazol reductase NimA-like FMN-containing flavoprotein (pyridoxamine 5'-phosphate oxidase superfamily)